MTPDAGEIVWTDFSPVAVPQGGCRPALVLSAKAFNDQTGRALLIPITSRDRGWPFHIPLGPGEPVGGVATVDQARVLDWRSRTIKSAGQASEALIHKVRHTLARIAGLP